MTTIRLALAALAMALAMALAAAPLALAHQTNKGPNGGVSVDAGNYHAELVADGTPTVVVFLSDKDDKPIPAAGFKANAILVIDGKSQRFELVPEDGSKLKGTAPAAVKPGAKGAIQLTAPDGTTAQAKY